jgi:hypothetical protein
MAIHAMSDEAQGLRNEINEAIRLATRVQQIALEYETTINELKGNIATLAISSNSSFARVAMRLTPAIGRNLWEDQETTGQVKTELQVWLNHV